MYIEQIYTKCLAEAAYYIESNGEAAIIDPLREVEPYIEMAKNRRAKIKYVFETHFHADFVSGHVDLAKKTGATIVYGPTTLKTGFEALIASDGQIFKLGDCEIKLIHTPGHTMESSCYLLKNEAGEEKALFSGDTLFIGDVGRPDLAQKVIAELTQDKLAGHLYESLHTKILPLSDDLIVYPGHGAGSACGKNMSKETTDTLGHQKQVNYALNPKLTKEEFKEQILDGLMPPPAYFPQDVLLNIRGYEALDTIVERGLKALGPDEFMKAADATDAIILDTRDAQVFAKGFIPGSINIGIEGSFAVWAGTLIDSVDHPILIVAEPGKEKDAVIRLARVGYDNTLGFLKGGFASWTAENRTADSIRSIDANDLYAATLQGEQEILDVRKASEFNSEHLVGAINEPLDYICQSNLRLDKSKTYYVHCAAGYRSMIFISILKGKGYHNLVDVRGGFTALKNSGKFQLTDYVCPVTML